jgi:hypothetical protein
MVVRTQSDGRSVTGIYIGTRNARRNFSRRVHSIELLLGHLHIYCELPPDFWRGQPQIRDARLADWLESKIFHSRSCWTPVPMALLRDGKNAFRLLPLRLPASSSAQFLRVGLVPSLARDHAPNPPCSFVVCRSRDYIGCSVNTMPRFRSLESLA